MVRSSKILMVVFALLLVAALATPALARDTTGTVISVNPEKLEFILRLNDGTEMPYELDEDATLYINGTESPFSELRAGDSVEVTDRCDEVQCFAIVIYCERK